jgi:MFS family permease
MLFGLGGTLVYSPSTSVTAHWFARRRATAVTIVVAGCGAGGIVYPILMQKLLDNLCEYATPALLTPSIP